MLASCRDSMHALSASAFRVTDIYQNLEAIVSCEYPKQLKTSLPIRSHAFCHYITPFHYWIPCLARDLHKTGSLRHKNDNMHKQDWVWFYSHPHLLFWHILYDCSEYWFPFVNGLFFLEYMHCLAGDGITSHRKYFTGSTVITVTSLWPASRLFANRLFRRRSKKTSKLRLTALCEGNPVEFPIKGQ